jgi:thiol-disulfide isomerase/thioredoxin
MLDVAVLSLWIVVFLQAAFICFLVKELAEIRDIAQSGSARDVLPLGVMAPEFTAFDLRSGGSVHSSSFIGKRRAILLLSPDCGDCRRISSQLGELPLALATQLIVLCHGGTRRCQRLVAKTTASIATVVDEQMDIVAAFKVRAFPALFVVDDDWHVRGQGYPYQASDIDKILKAAEQTVEEKQARAALVSVPAEAT